MRKRGVSASSLEHLRIRSRRRQEAGPRIEPFDFDLRRATERATFDRVADICIYAARHFVLDPQAVGD